MAHPTRFEVPSQHHSGQTIIRRELKTFRGLLCPDVPLRTQQTRVKEWGGLWGADVARQINRLTHLKVRSISAPGRYADGAGLYLVVDHVGARRWLLFYQWMGKRREMGLGSAADVPLSAAREAAQAARELVRTGRDPIEVRRQASAPRGIPTLGEVAQELIEDLRSGWKSPKTAAHWERTFETHAASIKGKPVDAISTADVLAVLKPIWNEKPETAANVRQRIERVLDAAKVKGLRAGENPAAWRGNLAHLLPKRRRLSRGHFPAMPVEVVPGFMGRLTERKGVAARALAWTVLTAARESMTLGARWSEIDDVTAVWTVPGERMKTGRDHRVPLSSAALAVLDCVRPPQHDSDDLIFPGAKAGRPLSNMAMDMLLRAMAPGYVPHGFRSTFRDWAGDHTTFPREVAEAALAHLVGNETERAYRRGDALEKRRALMEAWGSFAAGAMPTAQK